MSFVRVGFDEEGERLSVSVCPERGSLCECVFILVTFVCILVGFILMNFPEFLLASLDFLVRKQRQVGGGAWMMMMMRWRRKETGKDFYALEDTGQAQASKCK